MAGFTTALLDATVSATTILLFASLGEVITERAGILNLGVEGIMLMSALGGFVTTVTTGSYWLGFFAGIGLGVVLAALHAFLCISLQSNQVISGVMITLLGTGLTTYFGGDWVSESIDGFPEITIPYLVELPLIGPAFFQSTATDYIALALVPFVWFFLFRTNLGLETISVGEDPETADTMGINVFRTRYVAVLIGGGLAGAAGAHLSLAFSQLWTPGMTSGRGWIAVALVIFAQWRPERVLLGAYLFGALDALQLRSQMYSPSLSEGTAFAEVVNPIIEFLLNPSIMYTYPYIATILVLVITVVRSDNEQQAVPSALLESYSRKTD